MTWRCDGCQLVFQVVYDQADEEQNLPALATSDEQTLCQTCYAERFGPGPYESE